MKITPFLKWAGGKRWLASACPHLFPTSYNRYIEPFLGSAAIFFNICPSSSILSDSNQDLIDTYTALRDDWKKVEKFLFEHHRNHTSSYYYEIREKKYKSIYKNAAKFIYLNRTCWNGLYRVNLQGKFNVPIGTKTDVILNSDNFELISKILSNSEIICSDFEKIINRSQKDDFVFVDPPYTVKHNYNNFVKYNEKLFSWDDQIRLRNSVVRAVNRGAKILVTNANHSSVRELYNDFDRKMILQRSNVLAANPKNRGIYEEMAIISW